MRVKLHSSSLFLDVYFCSVSKLVLVFLLYKLLIVPFETGMYTAYKLDRDETDLLVFVAYLLCSLVEAQKIKVACVGNSVTFGYGLANPAEEAYPAQLQKLLGEGYEVGISVRVELRCFLKDTGLMYCRKSLKMQKLLLQIWS
jgi:hypothetical protein